MLYRNCSILDAHLFALSLCVCGDFGHSGATIFVEFNLFVVRAMIFSISNSIIVFVVVVVVAQCRCFRHHFNQNGIPCDQMPYRIERQQRHPHMCTAIEQKKYCRRNRRKMKICGMPKKNVVAALPTPLCELFRRCEKRTVCENGININLI